MIYWEVHVLRRGETAQLHKYLPTKEIADLVYEEFRTDPRIEVLQMYKVEKTLEAQI